MITDLRTRATGRVRSSLGAIVLIALGLALLVLVTRAFTPGHFVPRVHVQNDSPYAIDLSVATPARDGWTPVGTAQPGRITTFEDVYDQGGTWIFRFELLSQRSEVTMTRADLRRANWNIKVPAQLVDKLRAIGVPPSPVHSS